MNTIIQQICAEFYSNVCRFFTEDNEMSLLSVERKLFRHMSETTCLLLEAYLNQLDESMHKDKKGRKEAGLTVARRNDERTVLTRCGEIKYYRTYYKDKKNNCYRYPLDEIMDIEKYQRISSDIGLELAKAAQDSSYAKSSKQITGGKVSSQSVMHMVRKAKPVEVAVEEKQWVAALHVDADEAHITLNNGRKSMVPLISVYEGIERKGKRGSCKKVFHISEYGKKPDELWEQVLSEIERRYDLDGTQIYLHGDGAAWIEKGLEWLPKSKFVLDKYHKNKSIKAMTAGLSKDLRHGFDQAIRRALNENDCQSIELLRLSLMADNPQRAEKISEAAHYLSNNIAGVRICTVDFEANNGGCTEPHVSHVLSARLSSRPMKWSKETLTKLAPMLAARGELEPIGREKEISPLQAKAVSAVRKSFATKHPLGLPDPAAIGRIPAISFGKCTPLKRAVEIYA